MAAKEEKKEQIITAVYKVNLHCRKCACDIKKPLLRTEGVHSVDFDLEKNEIKVKGIIEVMKIHKQIEKWSKKKVDLISPKPEVKKIIAVSDKKTVEVKKEVFHTTVVKVHIHCGKCEKDLRRKLLKHKGIHTIKSDTKAQTLTINGTIESTKLINYIRKKIQKHAEIVSSKKEEEKEKKEEVKAVEVIKAKESVELKEKVKVEAKDKDGNIPYFIHYVYAPQLFSDENPNACSII